MPIFTVSLFHSASWFLKSPGVRYTLCAAFALVFVGMDVQAEGWGTIKGRIVWGGGRVPKPKEIDTSENKDRVACAALGKIYSRKLVVNPKNKGVKYVLVWLSTGDFRKDKTDLPIHPKRKPLSEKNVVLDQPCCQYEPHVFGIREGQTLQVKNSAKISHSVKLDTVGRSVSTIVPPGKSLPVKGLKADGYPILIGCAIHPWMSAYSRVFPHPYFAVTDKDGNFEIKDAPAGEYRLVAWQESTGWVLGERFPNKKGKPITVKADETTDVGNLKLVPEDD